MALKFLQFFFLFNPESVDHDCTGLKRTGKSCRLRWLNYLRPDVRRGNITLQEQLLILELHSRWGNRYLITCFLLPANSVFIEI